MSMNEAMDFIGSLLEQGFESWNTTFRKAQFMVYVPGFEYLTSDIQQQVVANLDSENLEDLDLVWQLRDKILPGITAQDFIEMLILDPNATDTVLPDLVPTQAEFCQMFKPELVFSQSIIGLIPSTIILFLLMLVQPRKNLWKGFLWGRPSLLVPINLIDEHGRRWAYCGAFALMSSFILDFFDQQYFWNPGHWLDPDWALRYSWVKPFILLGNVIHLGYLFYPLFACLSLRRHIPANILGLAYASFWLWSYIRELIECPIEPSEQGANLDIIEITRIVTLLPVFIGELAVICSFILDLGINSYRFYINYKDNFDKKYKQETRWGGKETVPLQYIEHLMTAHQEKPTTLKGKIKRIFVYTSVIGFKYPPRVICTMGVAFVLLLSLTFNIGAITDGFLIPFEEASGFTSTLAGLFGAGVNLSDPTVVKALVQAPRYVSGVRGCIIFANVVASLLHFGSMIHMLRTYRTHVRMMMRGDRSWHYDYQATPPSKLSYGLRYSGYQIAYLLWGYVIMFALVALLSTALTLIIIIPLTFGERPFFLDQIIIAVSTSVGTLLITYAQVFVSKFGFLQERGAHLALDNRRAYHIMGYFIFFFNIVLGAFSVLKRSLLSLIFGTVLLCRLDRCLLMRGFERFDSGFTAYLAMLEVDATHNHPVLKGFIYILENEVKDSKERQQETRSNGDAEKGVVLKEKTTHKIDKRIRNKWWKLITLVNNPVLVIERLQKKVKEEREKKHELRIPGNKISPGNEENAIDMIAATGAVFTEAGVVPDNVGVKHVPPTSDQPPEKVKPKRSSKKGSKIPTSPPYFETACLPPIKLNGDKASSSEGILESTPM